MGTSLCGMNAIAWLRQHPGRVESDVGLGGIIIGFQRTQLDGIYGLRIFARIDEVMLLLAREMDLDFGSTPLKSYDFTAARNTGKEKHPDNFVYSLPYDRHGRLSLDPESPKLTLDLSLGARVMLTAGPGKGYLGTIVETPTGRRASNGYSWTVRCPCTRENSPEQGKAMKLYPLGAWYLEEAMKGKMGMLPLVNAPE